MLEERGGEFNRRRGCRDGGPRLPPGARRGGLRALLSLWYHPLPIGGGVAQVVRAAES